MRKPMLMIAMAVMLLCAGLSWAQTMEPFLDAEQARSAGLNAEEFESVCKAVPRTCGISRKNTKMIWGTPQIKELSEKELAVACTAAPKLPICGITESDRKAWLKTKPGKMCARSMMWDPVLCGKLAAGKIEPGMTARMVAASWGAPKTVYRDARRGEEWVYGGMSYGGAYFGASGEFVFLFFQNGILKSWGESRYR